VGRVDGGVRVGVGVGRPVTLPGEGAAAVGLGKGVAGFAAGVPDCDGGRGAAVGSRQETPKGVVLLVMASGKPVAATAVDG
jgi:hypothetical protein